MDKRTEMIVKAIQQDKTPETCDNTCNDWMVSFEHRDRACCLSDIFSVKKGDLCYHKTPINKSCAIIFVSSDTKLIDKWRNKKLEAPNGK